MTVLPAVQSCDPEGSSHLAEREWLEADGLGGYAAGTVGGAPLRRYHGLLLVTRTPPHGRVMLVNHLDESLVFPAGPVDVSAGGELVSFTPSPCPTWRYRIGGAVIERAIVRPRGAQQVIVRWSLVSGPATVRLRLRPMLTGRVDHDAERESADIDTAAQVNGEVVSWQPHPDFPRVHAGCSGSYQHAPCWRRGIEYPIDRQRGEVAREDWWSPGEFTLDVQLGQSASLVFATDAASALHGEAAFVSEMRQRRDELSPEPRSHLEDALRKAARSFRASFAGGAAAIAGYPWFGVWSRDTFTSFTGLYLTTGRLTRARELLATFAPLIENGMLPANLPDASTAPRWNAADASLWFVVSVDRYLRYTHDDTVLVDFALEAVRKIIDGYAAGAPAHVRVDTDGLVAASSPDEALTWMDAVDQGQIFTPRRGKPVELQALWVHALGVASTMATRAGDRDFTRRCQARRRDAIASFRERFWNERTGYLFDVVDGPEGDDATLRPNQIFAVALDDDLLPADRARRVLDIVDHRLRTPFGLRTLAPDDPRYHPHYVGDKSRRDAAYHQGTVWPFLLGPFAQAWLRVHGRGEEARRDALGFFAVLEGYIDGAGCFGHLPEIFDAAPPHNGRGCFAQAWSAGEILGALDEIAGRSFR